MFDSIFFLTLSLSSLSLLSFFSKNQRKKVQIDLQAAQEQLDRFSW